MDEAVIQLASYSGTLTTVRGRRSGGGYEELAFAFERGTLHLAADADNDEVIVRVKDAIDELPQVTTHRSASCSGR